MLRGYFLRRLRDQGGVALILAMLIVLTLSVLSASMVVTTLLESNVSSIQRWDTQALFIADAGLEEAVYRINLLYPTEVTVNGETFNAAIKDTGSLDADWATKVFLCTYPPPSGSGNVEHTATIQDQDSWLTYCHPSDEDLALTVSHKLNDDGTVATLDGAAINLVTVYGRKGIAKREVLAELYPERWFPNSALLCDSLLDVGGGPIIDGTVPHVHTNGNMKIGGNPHIHGDASASGSIEVSGDPTIDGELIEGTPEQWIPNVRASDFYYMHEYRLDENGNQWYSDSTGCYDDLGWNFTGAKWKVGGNTAVDGVYYVEADIEITGNPGEPEDLWEATLICEGSITVGGTPFMVARYGGILLVAEGDANGDGVIDAQPVMEVSGTPSEHAANYSGALLSHGDLKIKGNPGVEGCLVAEGGIPIGGNPVIIYNGTRYIWPYVRYYPFTWRER